MLYEKRYTLLAEKRPIIRNLVDLLFERLSSKLEIKPFD